MKKLMMAVLVAACAAEALAMPTKAELTRAQPLVTELMEPAMAKYKAAGYKEKAAAAVKVGDTSSEFAKAAETEAVKFLLFKGAVSFYARGEQYDKAAETVVALQREVRDVPPAVIAEITGKAISRTSESKAPKLYAIYRQAKLQVRAADEVKALAAKLEKVKSDVLQRKYAEALAMSGDWNSAYAEFAKISDVATKDFIARESDGDATDSESGEFWWAYKPATPDDADFFKVRAAAFYRRAIDAGEIDGLKKNIVEQRIEKVKASSDALGGALGADGGLYCVIDLSGGPNATRYSVKYRNTIPKEGWSDEYKSTKLVLKQIPAGTFKMQGTKEVKITQPFYIGVFPVTQKQWTMITGGNPSWIRGDMHPLDTVCYANIRGKDKGLSWPRSNEVDGDSCVGKLRQRTGLGFDLPTEAQWEYACRAGTTTAYSYGDTPNGDYMWYRDNNNPGGTKDVGLKKPNPWGLYDMHGNNYEWCLDRMGDLVYGTDPKGAETGNDRVLRGGRFDWPAERGTSSYRYHFNPTFANRFGYGFRLAIQPK